LTRGKGGINKQSIHAFINKLKVKPAVKAALKKITPFNYVGV
jgi:adenylosuccinate lyase